MGSGCSVRFGRYSPDATSCRTQRWRSLWPTEVSGSANYSIWSSCFSCSSALRDMSLFFHSISHVQLSWPGHSKEGGLQSSSSGSGHQLWTSTSQVGHIRQEKLNSTLINTSNIVISSWLSLTPLCCVVCRGLCAAWLQAAESFEVPLLQSLK